MFLSKKASRARQREAEDARRNRLEIVKARANYSKQENTMKAPGSSVSPREIRRKLGLNQEEFWTRIGVTQSGGSRYESGRKMPAPVREMLRLIHVEHLDLSKIKKEDFDIIDLLKSQDSELYQRLRKALRVKPKKAGERGRGQRAVRILPRTGEAQVESTVNADGSTLSCN